jgi:dihydrodipicolinate synthase/N-acetylneuraminate lyase
MPSSIPSLVPGRIIDGISAVLLPYQDDDTADWRGFRDLIERTWTAGLVPAVNMDTGYVNLLSRDERARVLEETHEIAHGRSFVAGAYIEDERGAPASLYGKAVDGIRARGGTPILFPCSALASETEAAVLAVYRDVASAGGRILAFELGPMFVPFGRIYSLDFVARLMDIPAFAGVKHSSLDRGLEFARLALRDAHRPDFRIYTGNDLAIDMVFYGSDYLLGLSAFHVEAFAARDRLWAAGDPRAIQVNDVLQYLGQLAFRAPVPAYKHSAAQFLHLRGRIGTSRPHPRNPRRPDSDIALLADVRDRLDVELARNDA